MANVTLKEVAVEAGVSTAVASYVLRGIEHNRYRPETVSRVQATAERLGYQPNSVARLLRQKTTRLVGVAFSFQASYWHPLAMAVYNELLRRDYQPQLMELGPFNQVDAPLPGLSYLAGLINLDPSLVGNMDAFYRDLHRRMPAVAVAPMTNNDVDVVTTDRQQLPLLAAEHLAGLGHRRIAYAVAGTGGVTHSLKVAGWRRAVRKFGLDQRLAEPISVVGASQPDTAGQRLAATVLALEPRPTALICEGDELPVAVMSTWWSQGLRVPQDISVVGHGHGICGLCSFPPLTTVQPPVDDVARAAVKRLIERIEMGNDGLGMTPVQQLLTPSLIVRKSTMAPR